MHKEQKKHTKNPKIKHCKFQFFFVPLQNNSNYKQSTKKS